MGKAWMRVSNELLIEMLHLPEETEIIAAKEDYAPYSTIPDIKLLVSHPDINVDYVEPRHIRYFDENGKTTDVKFDSWN